MPSAVTSLDWLSPSKIVVGQRNGKVSLIDIANRDKSEEFDFCLTYQKYNPVWDLKVIDESNIAIACDSGHIYLLTCAD